MTAFDNGRILLSLGVSVLGLLSFLRVWWYKKLQEDWKPWAYHLLEGVALAHVAVGLASALANKRTWAHEDDIFAICATTFTVIWVTLPHVAGNMHSQLSSADTAARGFAVLVEVLHALVCIGGFILLGFVGARGKTEVDRDVVWIGVSFVAFARVLVQALVNIFNSDGTKMTFDAHWITRIVFWVFEAAGWALFAWGAIRHEIDLDTPVGFDV